ncbi:unnamed protein product [Merluccius merluccius]
MSVDEGPVTVCQMLWQGAPLDQVLEVRAPLRVVGSQIQHRLIRGSCSRVKQFASVAVVAAQMDPQPIHWACRGGRVEMVTVLKRT